jgi:FkbM family methyltransferase
MDKNTHKFFSQGGEDFLLWQVFGTDYRGNYVDIGAFDGVYLSNTYSFHLAGWKGICVEANPTSFALCEATRTTDICINAACGAPSSSKAEFLIEPSGLYSMLHRDDELSERSVEARYATRKLAFPGFSSIAVDVITLDSLLEGWCTENASVDVLSIDVEGAELDVLAGWRSEVRPRIVILEANTKEMESALRREMAERGYTLSRRTGVNLLFCRDREDALRIRATPIYCHIEKLQHPIGPEYALNGYSAGLKIDERLQFAEATIQTLQAQLEGVRKVERRIDAELDRFRHRNEGLEVALRSLKRVVADDARREAHLRQRNQNIYRQLELYRGNKIHRFIERCFALGRRVRAISKKEES